MLLRRTVPVSSWPITVDEVKQHVRVGHSDEDAMLQGLLESAFDTVGEMTGRVLAQETWEAGFDCVHGDLRLPKSPIIAVTGIAYYDENDVNQAAVQSDFYLFLDQDYSILRPKTGKAWPVTSRREDAIRVTFTAGYPALPSALRAAILMICAHWYRNREAVSTEGLGSPVTLAVESMIGVHRLGWAAG